MDLFERGLPFARYEFHEIEFVEPDQNYRLFHGLNAEHPDDVGYLVFQSDGDGVIYDARRKDPSVEWTHHSIVLRTNRAPATVVLLLVLRRRT